ncbi:hypothetical protein [Citreimonas sp.]|uniref:hypothetical protein n=1 Tax=Citreimonas sp. TaxID=3036715 RepID=UPI0035C81F35
MPVTSIALLILGVLAALALTVWALSAWGVAAVVTVLLCLALAARWAMAPIGHDDSHP